MLEVQLPQQLTNLVESWAVGNDCEIPTNHHITVLFVGRNRDESVSKRMIQHADLLFSKMDFPQNLMLQGRLEMFGYRYDHLVAIIKPDEHLSRMRNYLKLQFPETSDSFEFTPHITLAKASKNRTPPRVIRSEESIPVTHLVVKYGEYYLRYATRP